MKDDLKVKLPRMGIGFDAHDFSEGGHLKLGGVTFDDLPALKGHSDGDSLIHALIDALLGAAGLGDIGELFPDTSAAMKGISSVLMLEKTINLLKENDFLPYNIDVTVVADKPRLKDFKKMMEKFLADKVGLHPQSVNIKAKTSEGTRLLTEKGGIAAWAVATVISK